LTLPLLNGSWKKPGCVATAMGNNLTIEAIEAAAPTGAPAQDQGPADGDSQGVPMSNPTPTPLYSAAVRLVEADLSAIPTDPVTKAPVIPWKSYQTRLSTFGEVTLWFITKMYRALGIVCGAVSGNLEIEDFDNKAELFSAWAEIVKREAPGLFERLVIQKSQSDGRHIGYRCPEHKIPGNTKLAQREVDVTSSVLGRLRELGVDPHDEVSVKKVLPSIEAEIAGKKYVPRLVGGKFTVIVTLIETRGEGGQFLAAPSPGYELLQGDFTTIPIITAEERQILVDAALALNTYVDPAKIEGAGRRRPKGTGRPGDAFNETGDVVALLEKHGWTRVRESGDYQHYRRPCKTRGLSASLIQGKIFKMFTTNAHPFEAEKAYSPFAVYTLLKHNGDYSTAARELAKTGYGQHTSSEDSPSGSTGPYWIKDGAIGYDKKTKDGSTRS
jgi:hypothetical protein